MAELKNMKKNEIFMNMKRHLGMAVQATFRLEEMTNVFYLQLDEERKKRNAAAQTFTISEQNITELKKKLANEESARKSVDSALAGFQRQAKDQRKSLRDANDQLAASKEQILTLMKQLEEAQRLRGQAEKERDEAEKARAEAEREKDEAEQQGYDVGVAETEDRFRAEVPVVCRTYCAQTWEEALNCVGVEPSFELRRPENTYFPPAIRAPSPSSQQQEVPSIAVGSAEVAHNQNHLPSNQQKQPEVSEVVTETSLAKAVDGPKDEAASQSFEKDLASTILPTGEVLREKEKCVPSQETAKVPSPKLQIKLSK